jgi:hypothetical protein
MTHGKGKKKNWKSKLVKQSPTSKKWLWAAVAFFAPIGLSYVFPNGDTVSVVAFGWAFSLSALVALVYLFWTEVRWSRWQKAPVVLLAASAVTAFAYKTIPDRLQESYVLVSPLVWFEDGRWYFGFPHRGPKTCFSTKVFFTDEDRKQNLIQTNQSLGTNMNTFQSSLLVGDVNPKGHNLTFDAPRIIWKPFSPLNSHFTAEITWRDGGLHEDIRIVRVKNTWQYSIDAKDHDTGKVLLHCHDKDFPSTESSAPCFPEIVKASD